MYQYDVSENLKNEAAVLESTWTGGKGINLGKNNKPSASPTFAPTRSNLQLHLRIEEKHKIIENKYGCPWDFIPAQPHKLHEWEHLSAKAADPNLNNQEAQACCFTGKIVDLIKPIVQATHCRSRLYANGRLNKDGSESYFHADKNTKYCGEAAFDMANLNTKIIDCCAKKVPMRNAATGRTVMAVQRDADCHEKLAAIHGSTITDIKELRVNTRKCVLPGLEVSGLQV
jgi:hypothetical protein